MKYLRRAWVAPLLILSASWVAACGRATSEDPQPSCVPSWSFVATPLAIRRFCDDLHDAACDRAYGDCPALTAILSDPPYASIEECRADLPPTACVEDPTAWAYDAENGARCLDAVESLTCDELLAGQAYPACSGTYHRVPPDPNGCMAIGPGTYEGAIDESDTHYDGGSVDEYCLCLSSGQSLTVTFSYGGADPLPAGSIYVFDPAGSLVVNTPFVVEASSLYYHYVPELRADLDGPYLLLVSGYVNWHDGLGGFAATGEYELYVTVR